MWRRATRPLIQPLSKSGRPKQLVHLHADNAHYVMDKERDTIHKHTADMVLSDPTSFDSWSHTSELNDLHKDYKRDIKHTKLIHGTAQRANEASRIHRHYAFCSEGCIETHPVAQHCDNAVRTGITTGPASALCLCAASDVTNSATMSPVFTATHCALSYVRNVKTVRWHWMWHTCFVFRTYRVLSSAQRFRYNKCSVPFSIPYSKFCNN